MIFADLLPKRAWVFIKTALLPSALAVSAAAQDTSVEPLVVPYTSIPPFMYLDSQAQRTGFIVELAELIGSEIGVPIEYKEVTNSREFVGSQVSGETQLITGILRLPPLQQTNVFSEVVASDTLRPAVLADNLEAFSQGPFVGHTVAIVPPAVGSEEPILEQNVPVEYDSPQAALMELLSGKVDAVLLPPPVIYGLARDAGVDGRIAFAGDALRDATRHVALHESRADLLEPINTAIAKLEADGRLEALRLRFNIKVPPPPPDVLRVPLAHAPPYGIIGSDGTLGGYAHDVLEDLAALAGITISFEPVSLDEYFLAASTASVDALPIVLASNEIGEVLDLTSPIDSTPLEILVRSDDTRFESWDDLGEARVGTLPDTVGVAQENRLPAARVESFQTLDALSEALDRGRIDAIVEVTSALEGAGLTSTFQSIGAPPFTVKNAIGLRPGMGAIRDRLDAVIPGYLLSDDYAALRQKYFGVPEFWTQSRIYSLFGGLAFLLLLLSGALIWQRYVQRQRAFAAQEQALEKEQAHTQELGQLVADLKRSNRELDEFAYTASHDLKEPLRGIGINANFLARETLSDKARERVDRMATLSKRMEQLISDLLFFSRLGRGEEKAEDVDLNKLVEELKTELQEWLAEENSDVVLATTLPRIEANRAKIRTVFQNLMVNGIKYNDASDKKIEIGFDDLAVVDGVKLPSAFWVRDNGIGIEDSNKENVFRIFKRLNLEEAYGPGTGAGLSFVRKIVEDYGGTVVIDSAAGQGSTFYFTLPACMGHQPETAAITEQQAQYG